MGVIIDEMVRRLFAVAALTCMVVLFAITNVSAQESLPITNEHIQRIKDNCQAANLTLTQLHASDALMRVNRGQLYDLISTKLMARLNSRLTLNHLDATRLTSATASFDQSLSDFRSRYQAYEEQLATTLRIDCTKQPVEFYNAVTHSRDLRESVHESVQSLGRYINEYGSAFDSFRDSFHQPKTGTNS